MSSSDRLRSNTNQHVIKNSLSRGHDKTIDIAVRSLLASLNETYAPTVFHYQKRMMLSEIITGMQKDHPAIAVELGKPFGTSFITPDGGFIYFFDTAGSKKIILVSEVKRQGTNDKRLTEGLAKQAKGNAIERLGKNLIGIRAMFKTENILPFICFGSGCDFEDDSSILDRVLTMNDFFALNVMHVKKVYQPFEPASLFFREAEWSAEEMAEKMAIVAGIALEEYGIKPS